MQQDQQARISNTNISSNFHIITQYILQSYFKVEFRQLSSLNIVDLIVDQTYPGSITLRKLNENTSIKPYEYFNTISRDEDISRCPIFAMAIYFVIRWSHPNPPISIRNFDNIPLLDPSFISSNQSNANILNNVTNTSTTNSTVSRSELFQPSQDLTHLIFPWLLPLKQDMLLIDRTNYKLNSFVEVFEFFALTIIQDLKYLHNHPMLLPNIVSFVAKFIPDLFNNERFRKSTTTTDKDNLKANDKNYDDNGLLNNNDARYLELSKRLTTENIRLSQQITHLKSDLSSVHSMCDQILQLQKQLLSGSSQNTSPMDNSKNRQNNDRGGIIILDKSTLNNSTLSNLVQSIEDSQQQQQQQQLQLQQQQQRQQLEYQQADTPSLAPINMFSSLSNPIPPMFAPQQQQQQRSSLQSQDTGLKRKLPLPTSAPPTGPGPFSPSPGAATTAPTNPDSPYSKRFRFDDRPTPSQTALDSLLSKSIGSPKFPSIQPSGNSLNNGAVSRFSSRFASPTAFAGSPSTQTAPQTVLQTGSQAGPQTGSQTASSYPLQSTAQEDQSNMSGSVSNKQLDDNSNRYNEANEQESASEKTAAVISGSPQSKNSTNTKSDKSKLSQEENDAKPVSPKPITEKETSSKKKNQNGEKLGPNRHIKYKLSRDNKTIWDLYTEWFIGLNGKPSIKSLIDEYGWRRWKVGDDSHFFPTRRIIMDYIENECDRGIKLGRFTNPEQPRDDIRKILVGDLEKFRINNGMTLNSLSMYFRSLTRDNQEICIFDNFKNWNVRVMTEDERTKYCKRQHMKENG